MKYFTPDMLLRYGSSDEQVADEAFDEWEQKREAYREHLATILPKLPRAVRWLVGHVNLHDARVVWQGVGRHGLRYSMLLQLDCSPDKAVLLDYKLASKLTSDFHPELAESTGPLEWMYDELDLVSMGTITVFQHLILLSSGRELRLLFHELSARAYHIAAHDSGQMIAGNRSPHFDTPVH